MAVSQEDLEEPTHQSVIRGHHIYKDIWSPYIGEHLTMQREDSNTHNRHAVCLMNLTLLLPFLLFLIVSAPCSHRITVLEFNAKCLHVW